MPLPLVHFRSLPFFSIHFVRLVRHQGTGTLSAGDENTMPTSSDPVGPGAGRLTGALAARHDEHGEGDPDESAHQRPSSGVK